MFLHVFQRTEMLLWVKNARQVVRVVAEDDNIKDCFAGAQQKNSKLAILEERDGVGLSIIVDQYDKSI